MPRVAADLSRTNWKRTATSRGAPTSVLDAVLLMGGIERAGILPLWGVGLRLREVDGLGFKPLADVPLRRGVRAPFLAIT